MVKKMLEVCVDSLDSALAAERGGADRLELCANLVIGGTTPAVSLYRKVRASIKPETRVHVLLRSRFGDFLNTEDEYQLLKEDAVTFLEEGVDGIVSGFLRPDGTIWEERMKEFADLAHSYGKTFTMHRAFDVCRDPLEGLEVCKRTKVDRVLTSGQKASCLDGIELYKELDKNCGDVIILYCAGVDEDAIKIIGSQIPGAREFHASGKYIELSKMEYRKEGVNMGLDSLSEFEIWACDEEKIRRDKEALNAL